MFSSQFNQDRSLQTLTINGQLYSNEQMHAQGNNLSFLQQEFYQKYGQGSFLADLADFLAAWFSEGEQIEVMTSGSTGAPKRLLVSKQSMMNSAMLTVSFLGLKAHNTALLCMPLRYIAGKMVVVRALVASLEIIALKVSGNPLQEVLNKLPHVQLDFAAMIPMQVFNSLQNEAEQSLLKSIKHLIIGGGSVDQDLAQVLSTFPHAVWSTYGMTETLSHIALRKLSGKEASVWYTPFESVKLSTKEGALVIDAPLVSQEILYTNDLVEFNQQGQFKVLGRKDNTINTGGVKVQIEAVEQSLKPKLGQHFMISSRLHPKFGEAIVLLLDYQSLKELPANLHTPKILAQAQQEAVLPDNIVQYFKSSFDCLQAYARPKEIVVIANLPYTQTGKPERKSAKDLLNKLFNQCAFSEVDTKGLHNQGIAYIKV